MAIKMSRYVAQATPGAVNIPRQQDVQLRPYDNSFVEAFAGMGKAIEEHAIRTEEDQIAQQVVDKTTQFENESREKENEYLSLQGNNAANLEKDSLNYLNGLTDRIIGDVEDPRAREAIISQISPRRKSFMDRMFTHSRRERSSSLLSSQRARLESLNNDFLGAVDEGTEKAVLRNMEITVRSLGKAQGFTDEQIESSLAGQVSNSISSRAIFLADSNPQAAMQYYEKNKNLILPSSQIGLMDRLQGKADRLAAQAERARKDQRSILVGSLPDAEAFLFETGDSKWLRNTAVELRQLGFDKDADNVERQIQAGSMAFSFMERNSSHPFVNQLQTADSAFPITEVEGAAANVKAREYLKKIIGSNIKAFQNDPAGYVDESLPKNITPDKRVAARIELQKDMAEGMPNFVPSVLTASEKGYIKAQWDGTEDSKSKLNLLRGIDSQYGEYSNSVYEEAGIPLSATVAVDLINLTQAASTDAELIVTAATSKSKDIPKVEDLAPADIKSAVYDSAVYGVYSKVAQMFSADKRYNQSVAGLEQTLYNVISLTGETDKAEILDKYIGTIDDDDMLITFNKGMIKESSIEDFLEERKEQLVQSLPENTFPRIAAQENTVWIDNPSGSGWVLANKASQSLYKGIDGEPITVTPEEVVGLGGTTGRMPVESMR